jgi:hypothetical protein
MLQGQKAILYVLLAKSGELQNRQLLLGGKNHNREWLAWAYLPPAAKSEILKVETMKLIYRRAEFKTCQIKCDRRPPLLAVNERRGASIAVG